jgi:hypothetical protein
MNDIRDGYKLVSVRHGGKCVSYCMGFGEVHYIENEWAIPRERFGPLAVFDTLENVWDFLDSDRINDGDKIFKCKYVPSERGSVWFFNSNNEKHWEFLKFLPCGTRLADKVMIIEEVKKND